MPYHFLQQKVNELTGNPQIISFTEEQDVLDDKSVYAFGRIDFPEIEVIKYLILDKNALLEDVMCAEMLMLTGLLTNKKVRDILNQFNLPPHKFYPCYVKDERGNIYDYFWMQTSRDRDLEKFVDYGKSELYVKKDILGLQKERIEFQSAEDLEKIRLTLQTGQSIKFSKVFMNKNFALLNLDLFKISRLSIYWIISERLKSILETENVTGVVVREAKELYVEY
jgi:hypothetical protein